MIDPIAKIVATEEDRVNCPFYFKIGACRNGDRCNRSHTRPVSSQTLLLPHMYPCIPEALAVANDEDWDEATYDMAQAHLEQFYEEVFLELANYGEIEDLVVVDNVSEHMIGNAYVKYYHDDAAERALRGLPSRFYGGRLIQAEYTPVTDFREARCRAFHETRCSRGGYCNFMHIKHVPKAVKRRVVREMYEEHPEYLGSNGEPGCSNSPNPAKRPKRQASEERRAMIAEWNRELAAEQPSLTALPALPAPPLPALLAPQPLLALN
uniref:Uncharacterized protein n=1 Tax=Noctiluca scintillans TaxID=2966 RepID=A0A7S1AMU5_NOCSC|mmetsp:Transcript_52654/g.140379  ORF Transcript_52654/g.140379 Transcript_52654/m.140379 type:complete len:266 (+) Transcript_52654:78-875(+)